MTLIISVNLVSWLDFTLESGLMSLIYINGLWLMTFDLPMSSSQLSLDVNLWSTLFNVYKSFLFSSVDFPYNWFYDLATQTSHRQCFYNSPLYGNFLFTFFNWPYRCQILGVTTDIPCTMTPCISSMCRSCFHHVKAFHHIKYSLTDGMAETCDCPLFGSQLDYVNALLYGVNHKKLWMWFRTLFLGSLHCSSSSRNALDHLCELHWLPVEWR